MSLLFCGDFHFNHSLMLTTRPFQTIEEMNETLINNYNKVVTDKDIVWILGDVGFGRFSEIEKLIKRLKGRKNLIFGNHDERHRKDYIKSSLFQSTEYFKQIKIEKQKISLFHYPIFKWASCHYGAWHCHAHSHNNITEVNKELITQGQFRWDCGVDANIYFPISFEELKEKFKSSIPIGSETKEKYER